MTDASATATATDAARIHERDLADLSGVESRKIRHLSEQEILPPINDGLMPLEATLRALFRYLQKDENSTTKQRQAELLAARCKLTSNKADIAEIELARAKGDTFNAADVARQFADVITATRQRLLAAPSKFAGQFVGVETVTEAHKRWKAAAVSIANDLARPLDPAATPAKSKTKR